MNSETAKYIKGIRNAEKKQYAKDYYKYLHERKGEPPETNLSYMAAQAVRMNIEELNIK